MLEGLSEQVIPDEPELVRLTVPVKPPSGATVTFDAPDAPARTVTVVGLAETLKSVMLSLKLNAKVLVPDVPVPETRFEDTLHEDPGLRVRVLDPAP